MSNKNKLITLEEIASNMARLSQLVSLFGQLDERGQVTTLALLETAVKLHPKEPA